MTMPFDPQAAANAALAEVLASQWQGVPAVVLRSPPGAGKTGVAQRVALQSASMLGQRCMVVTQTNEQAFDLTRRLAANALSMPIHLFARRGLNLPDDVMRLPNLVVVNDIANLPNHPSITIGNAAKWSWIATTEPRFDLQVVDEAFQLPDYRFQLISNLAPRHVLIGDPGQIDPFVNCEIERWRCDPAEADSELAQELVASINRLLLRGALMSDDGNVSQVTPDKIGVVCAHVSQVNAVRERLGPGLSDVFVETANRFQGIERSFMFVHHPLSGRADATAFHLDAGRLCVMLSRHRIGCWIFGRHGIGEQLMRFAPVGDRALGIDDDPEYRGWRAHLTLMASLARTGRMYPAVNGLSPSPAAAAGR